MRDVNKSPGLWVLLFGMTVGSLSAAEKVVDSAPIPEPSIALLGGLCGVIFLLWRKK